MPIDTREESVYPLSVICRQLPVTARTGRHPHPSVIYRWATTGRKARDGSTVRLDAVVCGAGLGTSREAVERFFAELTARSGLPVTAPAAVERRERERTSRDLAALGLK